MKTYLYILITGLSILFACRKSDSPLYSEEARKEIDSILQKNCNTDSLLIFLDSFKVANNMYGQVATYGQLGKVYREMPLLTMPFNIIKEVWRWLLR